jgi:hypothetical protein
MDATSFEFHLILFLFWLWTGKSSGAEFASQAQHGRLFSELSGCTVIAKQPGRRFKKATTSIRHLSGLCGLLFKVKQICLTNTATDCFQVEFYISSGFCGKRTKQVSPQFSPRRTAQPGSLPDFADRVTPLITFPESQPPIVRGVHCLPGAGFQTRPSAPQAAIRPARQPVHDLSTA